MRAIDCQSFAGGFTLGVAQAGFEIVAKREGPGGFGMPMWEANRRLMNALDADVQVSDPEDWEPVKAEYVFGNPPCSGFSGLSVCIAENGDTTQRHDWRGIDSAANAWMHAHIEYAAKCDPDVVVFESVQGAGRMGLPLMRLLRDRLEDLTGDTYDLHHVFHNALSLGETSMRKRYFWLASRVPFGVEPVQLDRVKTLRDAIGDLEHVPLGSFEGHVLYDSRRSRRMRELAQATTWHPGEFSGDAYKRALAEGYVFSDEWITKSGGTVRTDAGTCMYSPRRWKYDEPARVLTGLGLEENVHPTQPRTFTHREAARIQGFPDDWSCKPAVEGGSMGQKWWGKGIPVGSGRWISHWVNASLVGSPGSIKGEPIGEREYKIDLTNDYKRFADARQMRLR